MRNQSDDRSLLARASEWAANATTIAVEMVLPVLAGAWLDDRLGTKGLFAIIGGVIGITAGVWALLRMVEPLRHARRPPREPQSPDKHVP